ncbi:tRNA1(Val) (adenine(37)-N6)-methyltransferase [Mammaliicoccus sp. Dog046]|uniref:tRNA1(Val) (adenine(37)-N6)-methyltransferase n=1 Tax=Mammaliicoccus sp. Dog046 TaxID=3034233 RepID=UPI002B25DF81|nr:tRNA1(Val) (adenine(37)-N6)-methyltransferase [Mammaliicoccus sp. Dog046]WQK85352.1 tRNA1(Val) (adenine(37)-N6)-methyltransferase [Mammaliicoccus sp. Dog046]
MLVDGERLDQLLRENFEIIQNDDVFSFSTDALLLGEFTKVRHKDQVMDLCTGNGIIPVLLAHKTRAKIQGVEIQPALVDMANRTIQHNHLENQIEIQQMDLKDVAKKYKPSTFDLVTVNPPYFKENQKIQHQKEAHKIARHEIYCTLDDVVKASKHLLKQGGKLVMVHRADRLMDVLSSFREHRIEPKRLKMVYSTPNKPEAITILVEGRNAGQAGLKIEQPFYIYDTDGEYSKEMKAVYYG